MSWTRISYGRAVRGPRGRETRGQPALTRAVGVHDPDLRLVASIGSIRDLRAVGRPRRVELEWGGTREPGQVRAVRVDRPHVLVVVERDPPGERREGRVRAGWSGRSCGGPRRWGRTARRRAAGAGHQKHEPCGRREWSTRVHVLLYDRAEEPVPLMRLGRGCREPGASPTGTA